MAKRRMFSLDVVDTDKFLELPVSSQNLYFHLGMRADDDGFISSPKKIASMVNCSADDLKLLIAKNYLIPFESGVVVVTDWKVNNWVRPDRKQETRFRDESSMLKVKNDVYQLVLECQPKVIPNDNPVTTKSHTEVRLGKYSIKKKEKDTSLDKIINSYTQDEELINTIRDFLKMRKAIKKPMTDRALKIMLNKLDKYADTPQKKIKILENSIENSWQGVFPLKDNCTLQHEQKKITDMF
ncbi:phage replication initiation protein [Clostridium butyricum]|uniref:phage replication initiation protein n=1 Tax=Clostridium butyricum TaxID=1492 RepID=UPI00374F830F|nr:phage replication initiation protein [Clostridium butyricum]